ncbi:LysR substrate-binding domain-containing protein [Bradyrhizobium sp. McL0616]|uniref:LysR substrate-binding domain-containing protein n=1 Tax=Bradyrhizobium sp. McL0616 TaxID=3415674 RepID=UPI003CF39988
MHFPASVFVVKQDHYEDMLEHLRTGRLDYLCTTARPDIPRKFKSEKLFASELCVVCEPEHPLARETNLDGKTLASYPWIGARPGTGAAARMATMFELEGMAPPPAVVTTPEFSLVRSLLFQTNSWRSPPAAPMGSTTPLRAFVSCQRPCRTRIAMSGCCHRAIWSRPRSGQNSCGFCAQRYMRRNCNQASTRVKAPAPFDYRRVVFREFRSRASASRHIRRIVVPDRAALGRDCFGRWQADDPRLADLPRQWRTEHK